MLSAFSGSQHPGGGRQGPAGLTSSRTSRRSSACSLVANELMLSMEAEAAYLAEAAMPVASREGPSTKPQQAVPRVDECGLAGRGDWLLLSQTGLPWCPSPLPPGTREHRNSLPDTVQNGRGVSRGRGEALARQLARLCLNGRRSQAPVWSTRRAALPPGRGPDGRRRGPCWQLRRW